jgi:hypothetical protein
MAEVGQSATPNHVRSDGSFPPKRSPCAGGGCTASQRQPRLLLMAQLAQIADGLFDCLIGEGMQSERDVRGHGARFSGRDNGVATVSRAGHTA